MKVVLFTLLLLVSNWVCLAQDNLSIEDCLHLDGFKFNEFRRADRTPKDTLIDVKNGYFEISDNNTKLLQAAKFNNPDGSILIAATGFYEDMQCSSYFTKFYIKQKNEARLHEIAHQFILPEINYLDFFTDSAIVEVAKKYQSQIQKKYYPEATLEDLYSEFYDMHFTLPRFGTNLEVSLTVCDFIPRNEVTFTKHDWDVIENNHTAITLLYSKKKNQFVLK